MKYHSFRILWQIFLFGCILLNGSSFIVDTKYAQAAASLTISPTSAGSDSYITISSSGWSPGETVKIYWDIIDPNTMMGAGVAAGDGTLTTIVFSFFDPSGQYPIIAIGNTSHIQQQQTFTLLSPSVSGDTSARPGTTDSVTVSGFWGNGYDAPDIISLYWDYSSSNAGTLIAKASADHEGGANIPFTIPSNATGNHIIGAIGSFSNLTATSIISISGTGSNKMSLSPAGGVPGDHVAITAVGFQPGELVQPVWNYAGPNTGIREGNFYYFKPVQAADATGIVHTNIFVPSAVAGSYTVATIGLTSGTVQSATFTMQPKLDIGIYRGDPGSTLRLNGWGFGAHESISLYWNAGTTSTGQLITTVIADGSGAFGNRTFTVPGTLADGSYIVKAIGSISGHTALATFTAPGPAMTNTLKASDWATFGFNLQGTRVNPAEKQISPSSASSLALKWRQPSMQSWMLRSSPTIANGILYVGTPQGLLIAYNADTGAVLWTFQTNSTLFSSPTIANGIAYVGTHSYPAEGTIGNYAYALDARTGSIIWENHLVTGEVSAPPIVANGRVFFTGAGKEGMSGGFSAFDAKTGTTLWQMNTAYGIWSPDTMDPTGTHLYIGTGNPCNGDSGTVGTPTPTPSGLQCSGYVEDVNPATGHINWQTLLPDLTGDDDVPTTPTYANGKLYVGGKDGFLFALDASTGAILWKYDTGARGDSGIYSSTAYANGIIYFGGGDHLVHALDANTGAVKWTFSTKAGVWSSPAVVNGVVVVASMDGNLYVLNATTGTKLWSYTTGMTTKGSPIVSNGVIYETGGDANVYAFSIGGA